MKLLNLTRQNSEKIRSVLTALAFLIFLSPALVRAQRPKPPRPTTTPNNLPQSPSVLVPAFESKGTGNQIGVYGETSASHTEDLSGVYGVSTGDGGIGMIGVADIGNAWGVYGHTKSPNGIGGYFKNTGGGLALKADGLAIMRVVQITGGDTSVALTVDGIASVKVLQITGGGSDLAEDFDVGEEARPGMLVAIDPFHAGKLSIARGAYNRRVAGVISGANNLHAGVVLPALDGSNKSMPVALTGRVWVYCDATRHPIEPGDLLTTSTTPGHAMKVANYARAQGAIIGKAMTGLKQRKGLVLVLVTLQ